MKHWTLHTSRFINYITVPKWETQGVSLAFSARQGGVSEGIYDSLNLGLHVGDQDNLVLKNRSRLMNIFKADLMEAVCCQQVHGNEVAAVTQSDRGKGAFRLDKTIPDCDAMVTASPRVYLMTFYADCVPVYFFDPVHRAVGLAHCGWKGTMGRIAEKTLLAMETKFKSKASQVQVFIGPGIGPCCFEIKADLAAKVYAEFTNQNGIITASEDDRYTWDLKKTNALILETMGVNQNNICICGLCTACRPDLFFSYRRDDGATGRMAALIGLNY